MNTASHQCAQSPPACADTQGKEYSCYTLAHEGRIVAHADTAASLSNLNYASQDHLGIWDWVHTFVTRSGVSGQVGGCWCGCGWDVAAAEITILRFVFRSLHARGVD
jgi:hypothetical protein